MDKEIRWKQRFVNLAKAFDRLKRGVAIAIPSDIEKQGIIQSFEFTFELSWKTLKDYLESRSVLVSFPRDVIKEAFGHELISGGPWMEMLEDRNLLAHSYDEENAQRAYLKIRNEYYPEIKKLVRLLETLR